MNAVITENDIVNYYEQCQVDYEIVWHLNSQMCMHYGYWDDTTTTLRSALRNMNAKLAAFAEIKPGEKIHVEIIAIDKDTMRYKGTFRKKDFIGEMNRVK